MLTKRNLNMSEKKSVRERVEVEIKINVSVKFKPLAQPLSPYSRSISFRLNPVNEEKVEERSNVISSYYFNPKLTEKINQFQPKLHVDLSSSQLIDPDMKIIADEVIRVRKCTELWLYNNRITDRGVEILIASLKENSTLKTLDLSSNQISDQGIRILSTGLHSNQKCSLKSLRLNNNFISNTGAKYLSDMLRNNQTITELWLTNNDIGWEGIEELTNVLAYHNETLKSLSLSSNRLVTDRSIGDFIQMLRHNQTLTHLWLTDCDISEQGQLRLEQIAKRKKNFRLDF